MILTRLIYPLTLREKISWRLRQFVSEDNEKDVSVCFGKSVRLDLFHKDTGHQSLILNGFYELEMTKRIITLAKQGGLFIDVGANYGYFSCLWASEHPANMVIAFEASPRNIPAIQNNITKNKFDGQIKLEAIALGREVGKAHFTLEDHNGQTGWGGLALDQTSASVEVNADTLDNYVEANNIHDISMLKIDVEGADTWVIQGAKTLIAQKRIKHIIYESNKYRMDRLHIAHTEAQAFLAEKGYVVEKLSNSEYHAYVA